MTDSIRSTALRGIQQSLSSINENVKKIASAFDEDGDLAEPFVNISLSKTEVKALVRVIKTTDELDQDILDILA